MQKPSCGCTASSSQDTCFHWHGELTALDNTLIHSIAMAYCDNIMLHTLFLQRCCGLCPGQAH